MAINERLIDTKVSGGAGGAGINYVYSKKSAVITSYDVSDPTNMVAGSSYNTVHGINNLSIDSVNNVGYGVNSRAITILDLSDPTNLSGTTTLILPSMGLRKCQIDSANSVLYAADGTYHGLRSIDVSNPSSMSVLDSELSSANMNAPESLAIDLDSNFAFLACGTGDRLASVNISNSSNLSYGTNSATTNLDFAYDVALDTVNEIAYVTARNSDSLVSIDISSPSTSLPQLDSVISSTNLDNANGVKLDLINEVAYVSSYRGITSIDISDPSNMSILDFYNGGGSYSLFFGLTVDSSAEIVYAQDYLGGVLIALDVSNPSSMTELGTLATSGSAGYFML